MAWSPTFNSCSEYTAKEDVKSKISSAAVININDDIRGEDFVVYIVLEAKSELRKIIETIHQERPSIEWPKSVYSITMLPLTECSKVDKRKLKEWYNKG